MSGLAAGAVVVSCEHATNAVPAHVDDWLASALSAARYAAFARARMSHRGYDEGARSLAVALARRAGCRPVLARASRLLVDCNRSPRGRGPLGEVARALSTEQQAALVAALWRTHWRRVARAVGAQLAGGGRACHVALHSFCPDLAPQRRFIDVGLLYDPARPAEGALVAALRVALARRWPGLRVRRNVPYRGVADGLPTALRRVLGPARYVGLEVEVNQALCRRPDWPALRAGLVAGLLDGLATQRV